MKGFDPAEYFTAKKSMRSNDRVTHFAVAATKLAIEDAGVDVAASADRCGVMVSYFSPEVATAIKRELSATSTKRATGEVAQIS